jgi:hypothetical protein
MKHVGKMKNNSARLAVVFRTLPGDPYSCLVVGTQGLADIYHDTLMSLIETPAAQQANELADILAVRRFPDGSVMLGYLDQNNHLKKVATNMVLMTPDTQTQLPLDKLNEIIAQQKGVSIEELAVSDGTTKVKKPAENTTVKEETKNDTTTNTFKLTPAEKRSRADALYKEAARLRKEADEEDPPKAKKKKTDQIKVE